MHYVYCITSDSSPPRRYVGYTEDIQSRLAAHNDGKNPATAKTHWNLTGFVAFDAKFRALDFEHYLKTGSGHAFARKRLW